MVDDGAPIVKSPARSCRASALRAGNVRTPSNVSTQRPGIMMCAEDVPTSMTQEPARV